MLLRIAGYDCNCKFEFFVCSIWGSILAGMFGICFIYSLFCLFFSVEYLELDDSSIYCLIEISIKFCCLIEISIWKIDSKNSMQMVRQLSNVLISIKKYDIFLYLFLYAIKKNFKTKKLIYNLTNKKESIC